ncbi:TlpA family protein disulfide reductase [Pseudoalteromonas phenolica]|uniref:TlpA family protein disulfide reductase n=1 Tax=Pseudoalteromonas phenolica TaxID=161398 RepID=UPI00110C10B5|nr:TlpA disulfide reductase family protein [Pseudoalteromonas phenolica]TMO55467.1 hypothetical protein CWC21_10635 [Pseudoalteromonas phenolica]
MKNLCMFLLCLLLLNLPISAQAAPLRVGDQAPEFSVTTLAGQQLALSKFVGKKPVYLKFWATWCQYCTNEMPHLARLHQKLQGDVEVITVNIALNDSVANIENFYAVNDLSLPTVFDKTGALTQSYGVMGTPFHVLIDKQGRIHQQSFFASDEFNQALLNLAKQ